MAAYSDGWYGALIFFLVLQVIASLLRYATRGFLVKRFGWDDLAAFITLSISITLCSIQIYILNNVGSASAFALPYNDLIHDGNLEFANLLLYGIGTMSLKITISLFYLRLFTKRSHRIIVYCMMAIAVSFGIVYFFFCLFQCGVPTDVVIKILIGSCFGYNTIAGIQYTQAILTAVIDLVYVVLPILHIRTVQMDRKTKWSVGGILCLGSAGGILTFVRLAWIKYWLTPKLNFFQTSESITVLSIGELSIGITCLALTTYKPLFKFFATSITKLRSSPQPSSDSQGSDATLRAHHNDSEKRAYNVDSQDRKYLGGSGGEYSSDGSNNTTLASAGRSSVETPTREYGYGIFGSGSDMTSTMSSNGFTTDLEKGQSTRSL